MRITGGRAKGIQLRTPAGLSTRPAADAIREALFSSLGQKIDGILFADLFAGTGSYGLEAWSRGAVGGSFLERNRNCIRCLTENVRRVASSAKLDEGTVQIFQMDVFKRQLSSRNEFDLVFVDPPYEQYSNKTSELFTIADQLLKSGGLLILEKPADLPLNPKDWGLRKEFGKSRGRGPSVGIWERRQVSLKVGR